MNTPGLRDQVVMRVLSDFYWTAATGVGFFTSNGAQRHADHCMQAARALCWERVSLTWIPVGTECWSIRSEKYTWCSDLSLCGRNMHSMKALFVLLICKLSTARQGTWWGNKMAERIGRKWVSPFSLSENGFLVYFVVCTSCYWLGQQSGLSRCSISCRNLMWWAPWDLPILVTGLGGVCPTISVKNLGEVIQSYHV